MRKMLFVLFAGIFFWGCQKNDDGTVTVVPLPPIDLNATDISTTQVNLLWTDKSTNEDGFKIQRKTGTGNFADVGTVGKDVTNFSDNGLVPNTTYTYRVYAFNNVGSSLTYTNEVTVTTSQNNAITGSQFNSNLTYGTVTDVDNNSYKTIQIGSKIWMAENLRTTRYRNGTSILNITNNTQWASNTTGAWCYYQNNSSYNISYGKLYNWYAVSNTNQLCPTGWHIPTDAEWNILIANLDPSYSAMVIGPQSTTAGGKMKSTGTPFWYTPNIDATNSSGWSGVAGGVRGFSGSTNGTFGNIGTAGNWWSSTESSASNAWVRNMNNNNGKIDRDNIFKWGGISVRCIKD